MSDDPHHHCSSEDLSPKSFEWFAKLCLAVAIIGMAVAIYFGFSYVISNL